MCAFPHARPPRVRESRVARKTPLCLLQTTHFFHNNVHRVLARSLICMDENKRESNASSNLDVPIFNFLDRFVNSSYIPFFIIVRYYGDEFPIGSAFDT